MYHCTSRLGARVEDVYSKETKWERERERAWECVWERERKEFITASWTLKIRAKIFLDVHWRKRNGARELNFGTNLKWKSLRSKFLSFWSFFKKWEADFKSNYQGPFPASFYFAFSTVDSKFVLFLPMTDFEQQTSGIGSDRPSNWATITVVNKF